MGVCSCSFQNLALCRIFCVVFSVASIATLYGINRKTDPKGKIS